MTAVGEVLLRRVCFRCLHCGHVEHGADRILGLDGYLTLQAQRITTLTGVRESFGRAESLLRELCGRELDDETIRRCCHAVAGRASRQREHLQGSAQQFAEAKGDWELQIDAGKANTDTGWRDVKLGVFAKRQRGEPCPISEWADRDLPRPGVRSVVCAIEEAKHFGPRVQAEAERLRMPEGVPLSVLGDGAEWIWNLTEKYFPGATQTLDIYHGVEHLHEGGHVALGEGNRDKEVHMRRGIELLIGDGYQGVVEWTGELSHHTKEGDGGALGGMLNYFAENRNRLNYVLRLRRGQSIGSGMVEGTVKQLLTRRIKQTGARWKTEKLAPFVELCAYEQLGQWEQLWTLN